MTIIETVYVNPKKLSLGPRQTPKVELFVK